MQELDVSKPVMFRNKWNVKEVKFLVSYGGNEDIKSLAFLVTFNSGNQDIYTRYASGRISSDIEDSEDIINVPEKPEFSWDKPIRVISKAYKYIRHENIAHSSHPKRVLLEMESGERTYYRYRENGALRFVELHNDLDLENYEPEEKYIIDKYDSQTRSYSVSKKDKDNALCYSIAAFYSEKDAELFKSAKEYGL